jgi:hypothetical protein
MAKKPTPKKSAKKPGEEWLLGRYPCTFEIDDGDETFRPDCVLVASGDAVLTTDVIHPDEPPEAALDSLEEAMATPLAGEPRRPARVRVSGAALVKALAPLRAEGIEIALGDTAALDPLAKAAIAELAEAQAAEEAARPKSYLQGATPEIARGFFKAAAALYRAAPWDAVPAYDYLLAFDAPELGCQSGCLSIFGQPEGEDEDLAELEPDAPGFTLFESIEDFFSLEDSDEGEEERPRVPVLSLFFHPPGAISRELRKEIAERGFELAGDEAYPDLYAIDAQGERRPVGRAELVRAWAVCEALLAFLAKHQQRLTLGSQEPLQEAIPLGALPGKPTATLIAPHPQLALSGEIDEELWGEFQDELESLLEGAKPKKKP